MQKIRLLINLYPMAEGKRLDEVSTCVRSHVENPYISEIVILDEGFPNQELLLHPKITRHIQVGRPMFADYYDHLSSKGLNMLSNNDIRFDATLKKISWLKLSPYDLLALARHEAGEKLFKPKEGDAQDTWIFRGKAEPLKNCHFPMGIPGCENRLAFLFFAKRYRVLNPARLIHTHHEHASQERSYKDVDRVQGHYLLTRPIGLIKFHVFRLLLKQIQRAEILRVKDLGAS